MRQLFKAWKPFLNFFPFAASAVLLASNATYAQTPPHPPLVDPIPAEIPSSGITVKLTKVMNGLISPVAGAVAPGHPEQLFVADQAGKIWSINVSEDEEAKPKLFLDLSGLLVSPLGISFGTVVKYDERGLLGIAFHPDFERNGLFYAYLSENATGTADFSTMGLNNPTHAPPNCQNVLLEWHVKATEDDNLKVDLSSKRELLRVDKPYLNHNGGSLNFGPDRMMYLSLGDGGNANDFGIGHEPLNGNAQTLATGNILGKIIRIDPLGHNSANGKYGIPDDNPYADHRSPLAGPHEIWAYGFRNPWRTSFDMETGDLIVTDVGQNDIEEVDIAQKGGNFGWPIKEGTFLFETSLPGRGGEGFVWADSVGSPAGLIDPIAEYDHADNEQPPAHSDVDTRVAAVGGYVYRGHRLKAVKGDYVFGDYSTEIGLPVAGHLWVLRGQGHLLNQATFRAGHCAHA